MCEKRSGQHIWGHQWVREGYLWGHHSSLARNEYLINAGLSHCFLTRQTLQFNSIMKSEGVGKGVGRRWGGGGRVCGRGWGGGGEGGGVA